eukprot:SAG22_NODE_18886_length_280_cov_0.861878_1_plen_71_part_10
MAKSYSIDSTPDGATAARASSSFRNATGGSVTSYGNDPLTLVAGGQARIVVPHSPGKFYWLWGSRDGVSGW